MAPADLSTRYCARLLLDWLNQRFETRFELSDTQGEAFVASDGEHRVGLYVAPLWEEEASWEGRLRALAERLDATGTDGSFLLWVPPRADVPAEEPKASDFVLRVQMAATPLPPGGRTEVTFPVTIKMGKMRDEELRAVGLIGSYEYAELEGASVTIKALDPSLFSRLPVVCILADGEVRPTFLPRSLPWAE